MQERIWKHIAAMHTPGFFVTAEMQRVGNSFPEGLEAFVAEKLEAIRRLDKRVIRPLLEKLPELGDFRILLLSDHKTLMSTRTHDGKPTEQWEVQIVITEDGYELLSW